MENLKAMFSVFAFFKPFLPIVGIALIFGFVRIWITSGIKYAIRLFLGTLIGIIALVIIASIIALVI